MTDSSWTRACSSTSFEAIADRLDAESAEAVLITALGELYYGAMKSTRSAENIRKVDTLAGRLTVVACDAETARWFAEVKDGLRRRGTPLPENDVWIAADCTAT